MRRYRVALWLGLLRPIEGLLHDCLNQWRILRRPCLRRLLSHLQDNRITSLNRGPDLFEDLPVRFIVCSRRLARQQQDPIAVSGLLLCGFNHGFY